MIKEVITPAQRCPKCKKLTLTFDPENNKITCSSCGYEARMRT